MIINQKMNGTLKLDFLAGAPHNTLEVLKNTFICLTDFVNKSFLNLRTSNSADLCELSQIKSIWRYLFHIGFIQLLKHQKISMLTFFRTTMENNSVELNFPNKWSPPFSFMIILCSDFDVSLCVECCTKKQCVFFRTISAYLQD